MSDKTQVTLEGDEVEVECTYETRDRPDVRFHTEHYILKTKAHTLRKWRKKENFRDFLLGKIKPKDNVREVSYDEYEEETTEILSAALHADLPDARPDWQRRSI